MEQLIDGYQDLLATDKRKGWELGKRTYRVISLDSGILSNGAIGRQVSRFTCQKYMKKLWTGQKNIWTNVLDSGIVYNGVIERLNCHMHMKMLRSWQKNIWIISLYNEILSNGAIEKQISRFT